ncbi:Reverse transcriptase domain-containing protein [Aphis craccivora]|uniref:Reverse transcriptase domain-containing protein n=1 Tax=Aphis craccivora TaxID=307492 RepID=A0A6G0ZQX5_APHCR|nr:Reverse transcriptase domain-containing protein [Aphis craccivora]
MYICEVPGKDRPNHIQRFSSNYRSKAGDAHSFLLFNIVLEKGIISIQHNGYGIVVGASKFDVLGFVDDSSLIGNSKKKL